MRGRKPTPTVVKLVTGNPGRRPLPDAPSEPTGFPLRPKYLKGRRALELWDEILAFGFWLTIADSLKLAAFCEQQADYERGGKLWATDRKRQHWSLASDLGLDNAARARMAGSSNGRKPKDPAEEHFT